MEERGEVELVGTPSVIWLGVPLFIEKEIIGAMVVQDYTMAQGATIGKAMQSLEQGQKGQILVLVTLQ